MLRALLLVSLVVLPSRALACATCDAGDPTLTLAGTEQPFAGRVRVSIAAATSETTSAADHTTDRRLSLGVAWAPDASLMLSAVAPLVLRETAHANLEHETAIAPGDLDLRARIVVLRDRAFAPTHLVTLQIGARIPLAPTLRDASERSLSDDAQTASPTVTPLVGLAWSVLAQPVSLQTFVLAAIPTRGADGGHGAFEARAGALLFVQPILPLSLVVGLEARAALVSTSLDASGAALFVTAGVVLGAGDLAPYFLVRAPVAQSFADGYVELPSFEIGAALDA